MVCFSLRNTQCGIHVKSIHSHNPRSDRETDTMIESLDRDDILAAYKRTKAHLTLKETDEFLSSLGLLFKPQADLSRCSC